MSDTADMWEIEGTDELATWFGTLSASDKEAVDVAVTMLAESGPALGRPLVDSIKSSRHPSMKELRPLATDIRVLSAFDPHASSRHDHPIDGTHDIHE